MKKILMTICVLTGCQPHPDNKSPAAQVLSKTDLTSNTSVYEMSIGGYRYIIVNSVNGVAICPR